MPKTPINPAQHWTTYAIPLFVGAGTFLAFLPALKNEFLTWDDTDNFVTNSGFRGLGLKQLSWMFTTYHMGPYQPLSWLSSALDYSLWGMNPAGYHFTNVLLHSLNAVLFYVVARRILALAFDALETDRRLAFASVVAAFFFSIHPLRVESVAWATERRDVLSGFFFLLAGLSYLNRWRKPTDTGAVHKWYWATVLLYFLGLLSKATALGLVWCLIALDIHPLKRLDMDPRRWLDKVNWPVLQEKIPFLILALVAVINGMFGLKHISLPVHSYSFHDRIAVCLFASISYIVKTLYPIHLLPLYELPLTTHELPTMFWPYVAIFIPVMLALWIGRRRWPAVWLAWMSYLLILLPVSGIAQNGPQILADRYSYLSCMPWALLLAGGLFTKRWETSGLMGVLLVGLGWLTWHQTALWHDDIRLWSYDTTLDPHAGLAEYNLGTAHLNAGHPEEAVTHLKISIDRNPLVADRYGNLGMAYAKQGRYQEAIEIYEKAAKLKPDLAIIQNDWGVALDAIGRKADAVAHYQEAIRLKPDYPEPYDNWGLLLAKEGRYADAIEKYEQAIKINPSLAITYIDLGAAYEQSGRPKEAIAQYQEAIHCDDHSVQAYSNLGMVLSKQGRTEEALAVEKKLNQLDPGNAGTHEDLARSLESENRIAEAEQEHREALRLNPGYLEARGNLGILLVRSGKMEEGLQNLREVVRMNPGAGEGHYNLAVALAMKGDQEEAAKEYRRAIALTPHSAKAYSELGMVLAIQGKDTEAIEQLKNALRWDPELAQTEYNLGVLLAKHGNPVEGQAHIQQALKRDPTLARLVQK